MDFFASWTNRDPCYHYYDSEASILVSPAGVGQSWSVNKWDILPKKIFIDSGAYSAKKTLPSVTDVLTTQNRLANGANNISSLFFAHPDRLIPVDTDFFGANQLIRSSLDRAKEYFDEIQKTNCRATPIGVIHGFDEETIIGSYEILKDIGYRHFALGSLAKRISRDKDTCLNALKIVSDFVIHPMHIFGISWPLHKDIYGLHCDSFDCSSPSKLGYFGSVLYGKPLERYVIAPSPDQKLHDKLFSFRQSLDKPMKCRCPICKDSPQRLAIKRGTPAKYDRAIHNYFQLKWATEKL